MSSTSDAIVLGAGHNGLLAPILLAEAGWSVIVLVRNDQPEYKEELLDRCCEER